LLWGFEISVESGERCDTVGVEGKLDGLVTAAIARLQRAGW